MTSAASPREAPCASRIRGAAIATCLLLIGAGLAPSALRAQAGEGEVGLAIGTRAPAAAVEDLDGNPAELLDYIGDGPALIEFWASWCENCEALQPQLDRIHATHGERLKIVAVAVAVSQSLRRVKRHLEAHDPGYPYLWDGRGAAVRAYEAPTTSVVVILDGEGKVAYTGVGGQQDLIGAVERIVGKAASGGS
jgi:thiol-disulfide isomerase/thioredoxin